jgi:dTMP kinase
MKKFIVFEGLDGSGLTTQAGLLRNYFLGKGYEVLLTKEPTDGLIGGLIRSCLRKEWATSSLTLQILYAADRSHHIKTEIEPALKSGKVVISDRYILSSLAYGSMNIDLQILKNLNETFPKPDLTIFIDNPPEVCMERIKKSRHHIELFEEQKKLEKIRENYHKLKAHFPNTYIIDGSEPVREVFSKIKTIVDGV